MVLTLVSGCTKCTLTLTTILVHLEIYNELSSIFHLWLQACYANNMWKQCIQYDTAKVSMNDSKVWKVCQLTTEDEVGEVEGCTCCKLAIFSCLWISSHIATVVALVKLSYWRRRLVLIMGKMPIYCPSVLHNLYRIPSRQVSTTWPSLRRQITSAIYAPATVCMPIPSRFLVV